MCSPNCMREFQKFWQNSLHTFLLAATGHPPFSSNVQSVQPLPSTSASDTFQTQPVFNQMVSQTPFHNTLTGLKTTHRRRRRRKRNKNRRFNQSYQQNNYFANNNNPNNDTNVQMRVKSIVSVKETHKMAEVNHQKNDQLKAALAISPYFIEGSSLDAARKAKEAMAAEQALHQKKYVLLKDPSPEPQLKTSKNNKEEKHKKSKKRESNTKRDSRMSSESESDSENSDSSDESSKKQKKGKSKDKRSKDNKKRKIKDRKSRKYRKHSDSSSGSDSDSNSDSGSSSGTESSDSSDSSDYKSKNSLRKDRSRREVRKRSPSPLMDRNRPKSYPELKESTHNFDDYNKTSHSIALNIRQMRKEAQNPAALERQPNTVNEDKTKDSKKDLSPKKGPSPARHRYSRSSSRSSERDSRVKRLKSAVYETSASRKTREVPKSYDERRYESKRDHSMSPNERSRHSSHSRRSRSRSVHSSDSKSSKRNSRSRSYSSSKSSSKSSKSSSRSKSRSRSPSIPRRKGSPSFLDKRRITSARKRPIPYRRGSPTGSHRSSRSSRSMSGCSSHSLSSDSFDSSAYKLI